MLAVGSDANRDAARVLEEIGLAQPFDPRSRRRRSMQADPGRRREELYRPSGQG